MVDVCIVGAGLSGLSAAIKLKQLCKEKESDLNVLVVDKKIDQISLRSSAIIMDTKVMEELLPNWKTDSTMPTGLMTPVASESLLYLSSRGSIKIPHTSFFRGQHLISLPKASSLLADKAQELGVNIEYGGAAMAKYDWENRVSGITAANQEIDARTTLIADGCRGTASTDVIARYRLDAKSETQHHSITISEVWDVPASEKASGSVLHTRGYPGPSPNDLGSVYQMDEKVFLSLKLTLDYTNPYFSPRNEYQKWKMHPAVQKHIGGGSLVASGARVAAEGGSASLPRLVFPGGAIVGGAAMVGNALTHQSTHLKIKAGLLAGEAAFRSLTGVGREIDPKTKAAVVNDELTEYQGAFERSWAMDEMHSVRNVRPGFRLGTTIGLAHSAICRWTKGREPWTIGDHRKQDQECLKPVADSQPIQYPGSTIDGAVGLATAPPQIELKDPELPSRLHGPFYGAFQEHLCPAGVFEYYVDDLQRMRMSIQGNRCIGCGACAVKDPNIKLRF